MQKVSKWTKKAQTEEVPEVAQVQQEVVTVSEQQDTVVDQIVDNTIQNSVIHIEQEQTKSPEPQSQADEKKKAWTKKPKQQDEMTEEQKLELDKFYQKANDFEKKIEELKKQQIETEHCDSSSIQLEPERSISLPQRQKNYNKWHRNPQQPDQQLTQLGKPLIQQNKPDYDSKQLHLENISNESNASIISDISTQSEQKKAWRKKTYIDVDDNVDEYDQITVESKTPNSIVQFYENENKAIIAQSIMLSITLITIYGISKLF